MSPNKSNKTQEIQDLLDIVKSDKDEEVRYQDDVLQFIQFYNLKRGRQHVRASIIKQLYRMWSKNPVPRNTLSARLNNYFQPFTKGMSAFYRLNQSVMNLSTEMYETLAKKKTRVRIIKHEEVVTFLEEKQFVKGQYYYHTDIFYKMFKRWARSKNIKPMSQFKFNKVLALYLPMNIRHVKQHWRKKKRFIIETSFAINRELIIKKSENNDKKETEPKI